MTSLTRRNPLRDLRLMQTQLDSFFEPFQRLIGTPDEWPSTWIPPVDLEESGDTLLLRAELPGMKAEEIDIRFENGILTLRGERKFENENGSRNFHRVERSYGSFARSFTLPSSIDPERVVARYQDGVLELSMPKREELRPRRIEIKSDSSGNLRQVEAAG